MLQSISSRQFVRWWAFYGLEPWGHTEENRRMGVLAATTANVAGKRLRRNVSPEDFMPREPTAPPSEDELVERAMALLGGTHGRSR